MTKSKKNRKNNMTKYQIYKILGSEQEYFYCKQKFGPFWVTPFDDSLRYSHWICSPEFSRNKNWKCRRFKTKDALLEQIKIIRDKEAANNKYKQDMSKIVHQPLEII